MKLLRACMWCASVLWLPAMTAQPGPNARSSLVHGLWVWKSDQVLGAPRGGEKLRDFCRAQGINEVYLAYSAGKAEADENAFEHAIKLLHGAGVRAEALLSSTDADEPGKHRDTLLDHAKEIVAFNRRHPAGAFDGIHLDIEPQQRPENKGPGNLRFLPGLADAFRAVRALAQPAGMTVNADIQNKLLKGSRAERRMLLAAVPRLTLMMYELSSPGDGQSGQQQADKAAQASGKFLVMAYEGLSGPNLARMAIALRTPDYGSELPQVLRTLDEVNRSNPQYLGWARHSYNDTLDAR